MEAFPCFLDVIPSPVLQNNICYDCTQSVVITIFVASVASVGGAEPPPPTPPTTATAVPVMDAIFKVNTRKLS